MTWERAFAALERMTLTQRYGEVLGEETNAAFRPPRESGIPAKGLRITGHPMTPATHPGFSAAIVTRTPSQARLPGDWSEARLSPHSATASSITSESPPSVTGVPRQMRQTMPRTSARSSAIKTDGRTWSGM